MSIPETEVAKQSIKKPKRLLGVRHVQYVMLFLIIVLSYGMRTTLSVAIIAMTDEDPPDTSIPTYPEWNNTEIILSSLYWGYVVTQAVAGQLSEKFGPKWFLLVTTVIGSIFHVLIPTMAASLGSTGVILCRVIQGLAQGFLYPSSHTLISKWAPSEELSTASGYIYGSCALGIVVAMALTGAIAGSSAMGWPVAFYVYGALSLTWSILWAVLGADGPLKHPSISQEERDYIVANCSANNRDKKKIPTPWKSIFLSLPVWSILVTNSGQCWQNFTLLTEIPTYLDKTMDFDINENGALSALPYLVLWFMILLAAPIADWLINRKILRIVTVRKIFNSLGVFLPAIALIWLGFIDGQQKTLVIVLLVVAVGFTALGFSGYLVNDIDLAPNHAGTLLGLTNGFASIFSFLGPMAVQILGDNKKDLMLWRKVFWLAAGISIFSALFYIVFASGDIQAWNEIEEDLEASKEGKTKEAEFNVN